MRKSEIKKMLMRMDDIPLPAKEKMLPPEALVESNKNARRERRPFPKLAAVGFAAVALVLAGALLVESIADNGGKSALPDNDSVLVNDGVSANVSSAPSSSEDNVAFVPTGTDDADFSSDGAIIADSTITSGLSNSGETEDMPIISCGKYSGSLCDDFSVTYEPGKVYFELMEGLLPADMDEYLTRDDALYAVYFQVAIGDHPKFAKEEIEPIERELQQKTNAYVENILSGLLSRYGKEGFNAAVNGFLNYFCEKEDIDLESVVGNLFSTLKDYKSYGEFVAKIVDYDDYDEFCNTFARFYACYDHKVIECMKSNDARFEYLEWRKTLWAELRTAFDEYEEKLFNLRRSLRETAETSMNEYLESLNIQFYEKTVYCKSSLDGEISPFTLESSDGVYSIAFLTREQIKSLEAGEDYALIIRLACEELATMDNEPAVVSDSFYNLDD